MTIDIVEGQKAESICRDIITTLPDYFALPEWNEKYAIGVKKCSCFAFRIKEEFVGMIALEFPYEKNANIFWLGVKKKFHKKSIGTKLINYASKFALKKKCDSMTVNTLSLKAADENYTRTYMFYLKNLFYPLFDMQVDDDLMVIMYKRLAPEISRQ